MTAEFELTENDYNKIADIIIKKKSEEGLLSSILETSYKVAENKYWHVFEKLNQELNIKDLFKKHSTSVILDEINKQGIIEKEINKIINVEEIKKLGAKRLREIASQLEKEAEEFYEDNL